MDTLNRRVLSSMYQKVIIRKDDGSVENSKQIKVTFLLKSIMSQGRPLTEYLAKIAQCSFAKDGCNDQIDVSSVKLDPTHGFIWKKGVLNT